MRSRSIDYRPTRDRPTNLTTGKISNGDHISARGRPTHFVWFYGGVFGFGGSNGAISGFAKFNRYVGENSAREVIRLTTI